MPESSETYDITKVAGHTLENIVYFELFRRRYDVAIGKLDNTEVDEFCVVSADSFIGVADNPKRH